MKEIHKRWGSSFSDRDFTISCLVGFLLIGLSLIINYYAARYALHSASNFVADIILSNTKPVNVDIIFMWGPLIFWSIIAAVGLYEPRRIPLILKSVAVLVVIRSVFITLTHIGPFPDMIPTVSMNFDFIKDLTSSANFFLFSSGGDLFFSAHTGLPFLMALVFWDQKIMRAFCLTSSVIFGIVVLLGHLHYTIDVASAFFITYTIYIIVCKLFPHDKQSFDQTTRK
jgi:hypothetical protein